MINTPPIMLNGPYSFEIKNEETCWCSTPMAWALLLHNLSAAATQNFPLSWPRVPSWAEDDQFPEVGRGRCFHASLLPPLLRWCGPRLCDGSRWTSLGDTLSENHWRVLVPPLVWRRVPSYLRHWFAASPPVPRTCWENLLEALLVIS